MGLEQSYNKDAKTKLFSGITQNKAALSKYLKALPSITSISEQTQKMVNMKIDETYSHESSAKKDRDSIHKLLCVAQERMINTFKNPTENLVNISTALVASSNELLQAKKKGLEALAKTEDLNALWWSPST